MTDIVIISGSHRRRGLSHDLARQLVEILSNVVPESQGEIVTLDEVPFWNEAVWDDVSQGADEWRGIARRFAMAEAFVFVAPEYGGMVPPRLMNLLLLCSGNELGHKPALAVGVSSTCGGSYPIAQLRSFGFKNNHVCWIPDHIIVRDVEVAIKTELHDENSYLYRYVCYCLRLLNAYAVSLKRVRMSGVVDLKQFPYGM